MSCHAVDRVDWCGLSKEILLSWSGSAVSFYRNSHQSNRKHVCFCFALLCRSRDARFLYLQPMFWDMLCRPWRLQSKVVIAYFPVALYKCGSNFISCMILIFDFCDIRQPSWIQQLLRCFISVNHLARFYQLRHNKTKTRLELKKKSLKPNFYTCLHYHVSMFYAASKCLHVSHIKDPWF